MAFNVHLSELNNFQYINANSFLKLKQEETNNIKTKRTLYKVRFVLLSKPVLLNSEYNTLKS